MTGRKTVELGAWAAQTARPIPANPRITITPTVRFRDVRVITFPLCRRHEAAACWNAGMPVARVNILKNPPEMTAFSGRPATLPSCPPRHRLTHQRRFTSGERPVHPLVTLELCPVPEWAHQSRIRVNDRSKQQ